MASYSAAYLLLGPGYSVLKTWKKRGGPSFDRRVFDQERSSLTALKDRPIAGVVPVPQRLERSFRMGRSPAQVIARKIADTIHAPLIDVLTKRENGKRQAELKYEERLTRPLRYDVEAPLPTNGELVLVDDFFTTGRTVRAAAEALHRAGAGPIHVFCLGIRPAISR